MSNIEAGWRLTFLHKDDQVCVVDKPAGIPVQPDGTGDTSLLEMVGQELRSRSIGLVHRLDRPVSGAVLFALDPATLRIMNDQFKQRKVLKRYWAIVEGKWERGEEVLAHHLRHDTKAKRSRVVSDGEGEPAKLNVKMLAQGDRFGLVEVTPEGGAFHQIRAQLSAAGHPIKGDVKYGARRGEKDRSISLHARSLRFHHPVDDTLIEILAPAPPGNIWAPLLNMAGIINVEGT